MEPGKIYILHDIGKTELTPEEAKEHLSDTELPPNMKKIIEGVEKMSRIDDIKGRLSYFPRELNDGGFSDNSLKYGARVDIEYLLSRLEIAESAFDDVLFEADIPVPDITAIKRLCTEALQQIRE